MKKRKKISLNFYQNTKANSVLNENGDYCYPIYCQINFNRKNTKLAFEIYKRYFTEEEFQDFFVDRNNENINKIINSYEERVRKVIYFEYNLFKEKYSLTGFSKRLGNYEESVQGVLNEFCSEELEKWAKDNFSYTIYKENFLDNNQLIFGDVEEAYCFIKKLYEEIPDLSIKFMNSFIASRMLLSFEIIVGKDLNDGESISIIEWFTKDFKKSFSKYLNGNPKIPKFFITHREFKFESKMIDSYISSIEKESFNFVHH